MYLNINIVKKTKENIHYFYYIYFVECVQHPFTCFFIKTFHKNVWSMVKKFYSEIFTLPIFWEDIQKVFVLVAEPGRILY